jgi:nucleoside-diphosphate-sugar epimerase
VIALVGASGFLGRELSAVLGDVLPVRARDVLDSDGAALQDVLARGGVVVNAAGARSGDLPTLRLLNVELPRLLSAVVERAGGHLVHLGSAAEYGTDQPDGWCDETSEPRPGSDYGRTKLEGTEHALSTGRATVLRVFNVAAEPPQDGSPLADIASRVADARAGGVVRLLSGRTARDWVRPSFVAASVAYAAEHRPTGLYNVCSGTAVRMSDMVHEALALLGSEATVEDEQRFPATSVVGRPERWASESGLAEAVDAADLGALIRRTVEQPARERQ